MTDGLRYRAARPGRAYDKAPDGKPVGAEMIISAPMGNEAIQVYRPLSLQLKLSRYSSSAGRSAGGGERLMRIETHTKIDGRYRLTDVTYGS